MPSKRATRPVHTCDDCGFGSPRWFGRCPDCGSWNGSSERTATGSPAPTVALSDVDTADDRIASGSAEIDRVAGGGLVRGSVSLLAGHPGIGKSTLLLQLLGGVAERGLPALLVSAEESLPQVARRAARLSIPMDRVRAVATTSLRDALEAAAGDRPGLVVVDSIQAVADEDVEGSAGSLNQVRGCAARLIRYAKETGAVVVVVGHVTKEGTVAGPKALEHAVDAVLELEGDRSGSMRLLRAVKNRFGSCDETGVFTMTAAGLEVVVDPSAMLLEDRARGAIGSVVFPAMQGSRPLLIEMQALVTKSSLSQPRRVAIGVDPKRVALLLGVLAKDDVIPKDHDVFVAAAGGVVVKEPAADLAISLALASAAFGVPVDPRTAAVGEVGLSGEVRRVPNVPRRLIEAARLGFARAFVPRGLATQDLGLETIEAVDVGRAFLPLIRGARTAA